MVNTFLSLAGKIQDSLSVLLAAIEGAGWKMLNETNPLGDLDLLLLGELAGRAGHVGGRIEDLRDGVVGLLGKRVTVVVTHHIYHGYHHYLDIRRRLLQLLYTITVVGIAVCQQGDIICCGGFQTVPHVSNPSEHGRTATRGWAGYRELC